MPPHVPWYKLMTEEELAAILAKPWSGGRTRWHEDGTIVPKSGLCVVKIAYARVDGGELPLMAGKIIPHLHYSTVFFHAFQAKQERTQAHHTTNCPCPVDTVLADWLTHIGVVWFYGYDRDAHRLWKATVEQITDAPVMEYAKQTVRQRFFLDRIYWESVGNLDEKPAQTGGHILVPDARSGVKDRKAILRIPFIPERDSVTLRHVPKF